MASANQKMTKWQTDALPRLTKRALDFLSAEQWLKRSRWYLAGGTALALHAGHRQSQDLDFFSPVSDFATGKLVARFPKDKWKTNIAREATVYGELLGAKVSFIAYPFFVVKETLSQYGAVRVLSPRDIAVMKIIAISQRGRKRDFVDLYWYALYQEPLIEAVRRLPEQYPHIAHNYQHIVKSLMYFADAERDPMPRLFFKADWRTIKAYFKREAPKAAREFLGLK